MIRRRDQQHQHRARMQRPNQRDNHPWKLTDPFLDPTSDKQNSFLSLLPPPPPRTASKILPPICHHPKTNTLPPLKLIGSSSSSSSSSHVKVQESPPPPPPPTPPSWEERQRDDYEWINKISEAIKKEPIGMKGSINSSSSSHLYGGKQGIQSQFRGENARILDFSTPPPQLFKIPTTCHNQMFCGAQRIAPAVQIRSVIPVCAAPPVRLCPNQSTPTTPPSSSSTTTTTSAELELELELGSSLRNKLKL